MRVLTVLAVGLSLIMPPASGSAQGQQRPADQGRGAPPLTAAQIRQQAAQRAATLTEWRALLSDPDVHVRLLSFREGARHPDPVVRELTLDMGLASEEASILEVTLRGVLSGTQLIVLRYADKDGNILEAQGAGRVRLVVQGQDATTGRTTGTLPDFNGYNWSGQVRGATFTFTDIHNVCSGNLTWNAEAGEFRGRINTGSGAPGYFHDVVWRIR